MHGRGKGSPLARAKERVLRGVGSKGVTDSQFSFDVIFSLFHGLALEDGDLNWKTILPASKVAQVTGDPVKAGLGIIVIEHKGLPSQSRSLILKSGDKDSIRGRATRGATMSALVNEVIIKAVMDQVPPLDSK